MGDSATTSEDISEIPFEQAIEELEEIVNAMESNQMPLDKLVDAYERGNRLVKTCQTRIDEAEQRIEQIASGVGSEEVRLETFDPEADPTGAAPAAAGGKTPQSKPKAKSKRSAPKAAPADDDEIRLF
ncbi:MAG: exodeoxyribonuclease VII small subunit [Verrucomicrobiota bacterium]